MLSHGHNLGNNGLARPFDSEYFSQLFEVLSSSLSYREDGIAEPAHAEVAEFLVEEFHT